LNQIDISSADTTDDEFGATSRGRSASNATDATSDTVAERNSPDRELVTMRVTLETMESKIALLKSQLSAMTEENLKLKSQLLLCTGVDDNEIKVQRTRIQDRHKENCNSQRLSLPHQPLPFTSDKLKTLMESRRYSVSASMIEQMPDELPPPPPLPNLPSPQARQSVIIYRRRNINLGFPQRMNID